MASGAPAAGAPHLRALVHKVGVPPKLLAQLDVPVGYLQAMAAPGGQACGSVRCAVPQAASAASESSPAHLHRCSRGAQLARLPGLPSQCSLRSCLKAPGAQGRVQLQMQLKGGTSGP